MKLLKRLCLFITVYLSPLRTKKLQLVMLIVFYCIACLPEHEAPRGDGTWSSCWEENCFDSHVLCLGSWAQRSKQVKIINLCLLIFGKTLLKNSIGVDCGCHCSQRRRLMWLTRWILCWQFTKRSIQYSDSKKFSVWFTLILKSRVVFVCFGRNNLNQYHSYCSNFDPDSDRKIRENGNFCPYDDYNDCLSLVYYYVTEVFSLCGQMEVCMIIQKVIIY